MPAQLSDSEVQSKLTDLPGWSVQGSSIERNFEFKDFAEALKFVNKVGAEAEEMDHHSDLLLHGWNKVKMTISTHSAKGITENDFELAKRTEKVNS